MEKERELRGGDSIGPSIWSPCFFLRIYASARKLLSGVWGVEQAGIELVHLSLKICTTGGNSFNFYLPLPKSRRTQHGASLYFEKYGRTGLPVHPRMYADDYVHHVTSETVGCAANERTNTRAFLVGGGESHVALAPISARIVDALAVRTQLSVDRTLVYVCRRHNNTSFSAQPVGSTENAGHENGGSNCRA